jgi:hypothetical protein
MKESFSTRKTLIPFKDKNKAINPRITKDVIPPIVTTARNI